ncbi:MAG: hypothetical protein COU33_00105 [Candidatus Magasanikbacteria bacterium CG10_big_fil_rev_8_21_14_0_10_43_6]|uniref:Uncharacterized protein n=1 Tax=Candidatus Magasanikbacteria bacterium CG10_big_fil_rev_8_21_14_0_10_43_6 TaxID=1974650 RepID=A0A2M6W2G4_9BACT|nr:MAG: hypothetical protein COU33_00105 [Candidatus Magasanikbacteria bacterium CG10_big_fil_rev_8_21_14_0_10_43_6]
MSDSKKKNDSPSQVQAADHQGDETLVGQLEGRRALRNELLLETGGRPLPKGTLAAMATRYGLD